MSTLAERLRGVIRGGSTEQDPSHSDRSQCGPGSAPPGNPRVADPAETLGGEWREARGQRFLVVDRRYSPGHRHGQMAVADSLPPAEGIWPRLSLLAGPPGGGASPAPGPGRMLFIDLETTGLAGGAGTYAFLVGCAWFDGGVFRIRQFFLSSFAAERALLEAVAEAAEASGTVVTYNGKSFDVPLIDTRFQLHRLATPFAGMPHVDLLHPARRLWRTDAGDDEDSGRLAAGRQSGCRLTALEETLCGHTREGDVPGFEIPARYFHYVRSGDARGLDAVMEHNRLDLLSLALLTARAARLLEDGPTAARTAREALGIGRLYERGGLFGDAHASFDRAAEMPGGDVQTRAEALRASAVLCRRQRRFEAAAAAWRRILDLRRCPPPIVREATEALAVHHEHRLRDPRAARGFALESMKLPGSDARQQALRHRLARLERKLGAAPPAAAPLF